MDSLKVRDNNFCKTPVHNTSKRQGEKMLFIFQTVVFFYKILYKIIIQYKYLLKSKPRPWERLTLAARV